MSATVSELPPEQAVWLGLAVSVHCPQSLSVTRITAGDASDIDVLNVNVIFAPLPRVCAKPLPAAVSVADVDVGGVDTSVPGIFTGT